MERHWIQSLQEWNPESPLSVLGPTGSGKTSETLAHLRKVFPNPQEVLLVSTDSIAQYRELDLGSAKPLGDERRDFDWVGIDMFSPVEKASVADYIRAVQAPILEAIAAKRPLVILGGSHFYERALVEGMSTGQASDQPFQQELSPFDTASLHRRLVKIEAKFADKIHPNDRYRIVRALDLSERQHLSFDEIYTQKSEGLLHSFAQIQVFALGMDFHSDLYRKRLASRIQAMLSAGWIDECSTILANHVGQEIPALQSVGYRKVVKFLKGELPRPSLEEEILIDHWGLGKKQRTWIRGLQKKNTARSS